MLLVHERRFLASLIDVGVVLIISTILNIIVPNTIFNSDLTFSIIYFIVSFTYMFLSLLITKDTTIGMYSVSAKYMGKDWNKPTKKAIILRALIQGVPALYLINILYMFLNKTDETFFDKVSDTFVVKVGETYNIENDDKQI